MKASEWARGLVDAVLDGCAYCGDCPDGGPYDPRCPIGAILSNGVLPARIAAMERVVEAARKLKDDPWVCDYCEFNSPRVDCSDECPDIMLVFAFAALDEVEA